MKVCWHFVAVLFMAGAACAQPMSRARDAFLLDVNSVAGISRTGAALLAADPTKRKWGDYCRVSQALARDGKFRLAIREAAKALYIGQNAGGSGTAVIFASNDIATAYSYAGDHETSGLWADRTLTAIGMGHEPWAREDVALIGANAHRIKALGFSASGQHVPAVQAIEAAMKALQSVPSWRLLKSEMSIALVSIYVRAGLHDRAVPEIAKLLTETDPQLMPSIRRVAGDAALARKDAVAAGEHYAKGLEVQSADRFQVTMLRLGIARVARQLGDPAKAEQELLMALANLEEVRSAFSSIEMRTALYGNLQSVFDEAVDFFHARGDAQRAFDVSESSRARAMLDLQRQGSAPGDSAPTPSAALSVAEVRSRLADGQLLVVYHQLPTHLLAWVVARDGLRTSHALPLAADDLRRQIVGFRRALDSAVGRDGTEISNASRGLFGRLVQPLALPSEVDLIIVPHKSLHLVPFQALQDGDKWLIERNPIATAISASLVGAGHAVTAPTTLAALGNPDIGRAEWALPGAEEEVKAIATLYSGAGVYVQKEATKARLIQASRGASVIHVAAHAVVDEIDPMSSTIKLAGFGLPGADMEAREVAALDLKSARLVTLSACNSGLGTVAQGDEFMGFKRALFAGGASSALVSLWSVDDESTRVLMTEFHRLWKSESMVRAMQKAQIAVLRDPKHSNPYYWAAFVLVGDTR